MATVTDPAFRSCRKGKVLWGLEELAADRYAVLYMYIYVLLTATSLLTAVATAVTADVSAAGTGTGGDSGVDTTQ